MILFIHFILFVFDYFLSVQPELLHYEYKEIHQDSSSRFEFERKVLSQFFKETNVLSHWKESNLWLDTYTSHCEWFGIVCNEEGNVIEVRLVNNSLSGELPQILCQLTELKVIDLSGNQLQGNLNDAHFFGLDNLELLDLSRNKFSSFEVPDSSRKRNRILPKLETLKIGSNSLEKLSPYFGSHFGESLRVLDFSFNLLRELPETFGDLQSLTYLDIGGNNNLSPFKTSSEWVLKNLIILELQHTIIVQLPDWIEGMESLEEIGLKQTKLSIFPSILMNINSLKSIVLSGNRIIKVPSALDLLTHLERFECLDCEMTSFPVLHHPNMTILTLAGNPLKELDVSFLSQLQNLAVKCQKLIPTSFGNFSSLNTLSLGGEYFQELPKDLPRAITRLSLINSSISKWPSDISIENLKIFSIVSFKSDNFEFPYFFSSSPVLNKRLSILGNATGTIPSSLSNFDAFEITSTSMEGTLPTEIGLASNLTILVISKNPSIVGDIPTEISLLKKLETLNIEGNSFNTVLSQELKTLNPSLTCQFNQEQEFTCNSEKMVEIEKVCNVKCTNPHTLKGVWLLGECKVINSISAMIDFKYEIEENGEMIYVAAYSTECSQTSGTTRYTGTLEIESEKSLGNEEYFLEVKYIRSNSEMFIHNTALYNFYLNYCGLDYEIGEWVDDSEITCSASAYGLNASRISLKDCPEYKFNWIVNFKKQTLISISKNYDCVPLSINPGTIQLTRDWDCPEDTNFNLCKPICGDGSLLDFEQCDDGNNLNFDGCDSNCNIEKGWKCSLMTNTSTSICTSILENDENKSNSDSSDSLFISLIISIPLIILIIIFGIWTKIRNESQLLISPNELELVQILGEGHFGQVYKGLWRGSTEVAIKVLKENSSELVKDFTKESKVLKTLPPHPNVVQFLGICLKSINSDEKQMNIVTEFLSEGDMYTFLKRKEIDPYHITVLESSDMRLMIDLAKGIAAGMDHLHQNNIIHRDLAARNILIQSLVGSSFTGEKYKVIPKISDFGLAGSKDKIIVPLRWASPEVLKNPKSTSKYSDVWSFGVVLYEISVFCSVPPYFEEKTHTNVVSYILGGGTLRPPECSPPQFSLMMGSCFSSVPEFRPSFSTICHSFAYNLETEDLPTFSDSETIPNYETTDTIYSHIQSISQKYD